jgi:hypothetical protein
MQLSLRRPAGRSAGRLLAVVLALSGAAAIAAPVAAATPPTSDWGNTVECRYHLPGPSPVGDWRIRSFNVLPPVVKANSGTQIVGWRFVVTRATNWGGDPWTVTYRSPIQKASATTTHKAAFTSKSVAVAIPHVENLTSVWYHVTLKLYWYRANGSIQSQQSYQMPYLKSLQDGHYYGDYDDICQAGFYEGP